MEKMLKLKLWRRGHFLFFVFSPTCWLTQNYNRWISWSKRWPSQRVISLNTLNVLRWWKRPLFYNWCVCTDHINNINEAHGGNVHFKWNTNNNFVVIWLFENTPHLIVTQHLIFSEIFKGSRYPVCSLNNVALAYLAWPFYIWYLVNVICLHKNTSLTKSK